MAQLVTKMQRIRHQRCREEKLFHLGTSLRAGLPVDTQELSVHIAGHKDVRLTTAEGDSTRRVYMPGALKWFWWVHTRRGRVHI